MSTSRSLNLWYATAAYHVHVVRRAHLWDQLATIPRTSEQPKFHLSPPPRRPLSSTSYWIRPNVAHCTFPAPHMACSGATLVKFGADECCRGGECVRYCRVVIEYYRRMGRSMEHPAVSPGAVVDLWIQSVRGTLLLVVAALEVFFSSSEETETNIASI